MSAAAPTSFRRGLASAIATAVVAASALVGVTATASAEEEAPSGSLSWGLISGWNDYVTGRTVPPPGTITGSGGATVLAADGAETFTFPEAEDSDYDPDSGLGTIRYSGAIRFQKLAHGIDMVLQDPWIVFAESGATLTAEKSSSENSGFTVGPRGVIASLDVPDGQPSGSELLSWSAVPTTIETVSGESPENGWLSNYNNQSGTPASFTFGHSAPVVAVSTSTTLEVAPEAQAEAGATVTLTATVEPSDAAGAVQFFDGESSIGEPVELSAGQAVLPTSSLAEGGRTLSAQFIPSDETAFLGSESSGIAYEIVAAASEDDEYETTTTLGVSPDAPAVLGSEVTLTATVEAADSAAPAPAGSVEFFRYTALSSDAVSLGSETLSDGVAQLSTTELPAGGHVFEAVFTPSSPSLLGSSGLAPALPGPGPGGSTPAQPNYGVVDTSLDLVDGPAPELSRDAEGATIRWAYSDYSDFSSSQFSPAWQKTASGDISVDEDRVFVFENGSVTADENAAVISFEGSFKLLAYPSQGGFWIEVADPQLTITTDGDGFWSGVVETGVGETIVGEATELVFATFAGASGLPEPAGESTSFEIGFDYEGTTAPATWHAGNSAAPVAHTDAWPNGYILHAPSSIRGFYYSSGASADWRKPPAPATVEFAWPDVPAQTSTAVSVSPAAPVVLGAGASTASVTVSATVSPSTAVGAVVFTVLGLDGPDVLDAVPLVDGAASAPLTLPAGGYRFEAAFVPSDADDFAASSGTTRTGATTNYGVVDVSEPSVWTPPSTATVLSGITASWDYSAYSSAWDKTATGNISIEADSETFVLTDGVASFTADGAVVEFAGTIHLLAYAGFGGAWVEIADPVLTILADGSGTWSGTVTTQNRVGQPSDAGPDFLVITTFEGAAFPDFSEDGSTSVEFDYAGTTAPGTWAQRDGAGLYADAWSNGFVLQVPSTIRAFYYASGANADPNKSPAPLGLAWSAAPDDGDDSPEPGTVHAVSGATLSWGVRDTFRDYVAGPIANGTISTFGGVTLDGSPYLWTGGVGAFDPAGQTGEVAFPGGVRFTGHGGTLDVTISGLSIEITGPSTAVLHSDGVSIAELTLPAPLVTSGSVTYSAATAVLTTGGSALFGGFYQAGAPLDPVTIVLPLGALVDPGEDGGETPAPSVPPSVEFDADDLVPGGTVTFTGSGFLPGELVTATVYSDPLVIGTRAANSNGEVSFTWTVPLDFPTGWHTIELRGESGTTVSARFFIEGASVVEPVAEAQESCFANAVNGATLSWGVKESFRSYVVGPIANGSISTFGGVTTGGSPYLWSGGSGSYNVDETLGSVSFGGGVRFTGHSGTLDLTISDLSVRITGPGSAVLYSGGTALATLALPAAQTSDSTVSFVGAGARLTSAGAVLFGDFYESGEVLDSLSLTLPLGDEIVCDATTDPALASTGASDTGAAWLGAGMLVLGAALLVLRNARRRSPATIAS